MKQRHESPLKNCITPLLLVVVIINSREQQMGRPVTHRQTQNPGNSKIFRKSAKERQRFGKETKQPPIT